MSKSINGVARAAHDQLAHDEVENKNEEKEEKEESSDESDDDQFFRQHMAQLGVNIDAPIEDEEEEEPLAGPLPLVRQAERMNEGMQGGKKTRWKKHRRFVPCKKNTTQKLRKRRH